VGQEVNQDLRVKRVKKTLDWCKNVTNVWANRPWCLINDTRWPDIFQSVVDIESCNQRLCRIRR